MHKSIARHWKPRDDVLSTFLFQSIHYCVDRTFLALKLIHVKESIDEQYWQEDEIQFVRLENGVSSIEIDRLRLFQNLLWQIAGISPTRYHVIRGAVAKVTIRSKVDRARGAPLLTAHIVDAVEQKTYTTLQAPHDGSSQSLNEL